MDDRAQGTGGQPVRQQGGGFVDEDNIGSHFMVIAVINLVFSVPVVLFGALVFLGSLVGAGFAQAFSDVPGIGGLVAGAGLVVGLLIAAAGLPGTLSGIGLLQRRSWAKIWTLVDAALSLLWFPVGTAYGVYVIWVMTRPETDAALGSSQGSEPKPS